MITNQRCKICKAGQSETIDAMLSEKVSLRNIESSTVFSLQNVRSHKLHAKLTEPKNDDFAQQISQQKNRLVRTLYEAKQKCPDDFLLHIKIENEIAKSLRQLTSLNEKKLIEQANEKQSSLTAQIASLSEELLKAVSHYPDAQAALSEVFKSYTNDRGQDD